MRKPMAAFATVCALAAPAIIMTRAPAATSNQQKFEQIERGRYLATLADCAACHTKKDGGEPFAGGRPIETPFGMIFSANITPDHGTGIGNWTEQQFDNALRYGIRPDGSRLYPAMPYVSLTKMSRDDVNAIRAYLATLPPVPNRVVTNQLPFPYNIRLAMRGWDFLFFTPGEFKPNPEKSAEWNHGAFLVEGPGHCGACHTPKNFLGADENSKALQGGQVQGWFAPNITNDKMRGLGAMSVDDIAALLKSGHNRIATVTGPMAEEVEDSSSHFSDGDLKAIAAYLKSLPGGDHNETPVAESDPRMQAGKAIFRDTCSACHGIDGKGVPNLFPALATASSVRSIDPTSAIRVVLRGARSVATKAEPTAPAMPSFGWQLKDDQVAAVLTYVRNSWGSAAKPVSANDVGNQRSKLANRTE
jgi:mono/diheme cytochrome c family protein